MPLRISEARLKQITSSFSYKTQGDTNEREYGHFIKNFKYSELFWRDFITPLTNRFNKQVSEPEFIIRARDGVSDDLVDLSSMHYSIFINFVNAGLCIQEKHFSYFENFYTHLGSICDLAEDFLIKIHLLILKSTGLNSPILQELDEKDAVDLAIKWHKDIYPTVYDFYLNKGKFVGAKLIGRPNIVKEYFGKSSALSAYNKTSGELRAYRNVIVHNIQVAWQEVGTEIWVPKRNKIGKYKKWRAVSKASEEQIQTDFTERDAQMRSDLEELATRLENLWNKPYDDINKLLFIDKNKILLSEYDIKFIDGDSENSASESGFLGPNSPSQTSGKASSSGYSGYGGNSD